MAQENETDDDILLEYVKSVLDCIYEEEKNENNFVYNDRPDKVIVVEQNIESRDHQDANEPI